MNSEYSNEYYEKLTEINTNKITGRQTSTHVRWCLMPQTLLLLWPEMHWSLLLFFLHNNTPMIIHIKDSDLQHMQTSIINTLRLKNSTLIAITLSAVFHNFDRCYYRKFATTAYITNPINCTILYNVITMFSCSNWVYWCTISTGVSALTTSAILCSLLRLPPADQVFGPRTVTCIKCHSWGLFSESERLVTPVLVCGTVCRLQSRPLQTLHPSAGS